jgi:hypothetical protein
MHAAFTKAFAIMDASSAPSQPFCPNGVAASASGKSYCCAASCTKCGLSGCGNRSPGRHRH